MVLWILYHKLLKIFLLFHFVCYHSTYVPLANFQKFLLEEQEVSSIYVKIVNYFGVGVSVSAPQDVNINSNI